MADNNSLLTGGNGSQIIGDTSDYTARKYAQILVLEATVFANLEEGDYDAAGVASTPYDAKAAAYQNCTGVTVAAGAILKPHSKFFTRVKLTSGQVEGFIG